MYTPIDRETQDSYCHHIEIDQRSSYQSMGLSRIARIAVFVREVDRFAQFYNNA